MDELVIVNPIPLEDIENIKNGFFCDFDNDKFKVIGSGSFSTVYSYKNYAIKHFTEEVCDDGRILKSIGESKWFPKVFMYNDNFMVVEKIDGINVDWLIERSSSNEYSDYIFEEIANESILELTNLLNEKRYYASDIHGDNIMITKEGRMVIVDVGLFSPFFYEENEQIQTNELEIVETFIEQVNYKVRENTLNNYKLNYILN